MKLSRVASESASPNRLRRNSLPPGAIRETARGSIAALLAQEILGNASPASYLLESEHTLCRRFSVSRVTVRLALGDLENRGLIFRKHGKGTYAHGLSTRVHRNLGILIKSPLTIEDRTLAEIIRGVQTVMTPLRAVLSLIGISPTAWLPELAKSLAGVIVIPESVTVEDIDSFRDRKLPFLIIGNSDLLGPRIHLNQRDAIAPDGFGGVESPTFTAGRLAAEALNRADLTGETLGDVFLPSTSPSCDPSVEIRENFVKETDTVFDSSLPVDTA